MSLVDFISGIVLVLLIYLPGHLAGGLLARRGDGPSEAVLLRLAVSVGIATPVLTALAVFGRFHFFWIVGSMLLAAVIVRSWAYLVARRSGGAGVRREGFRVGDLLALIVFVAAFLLYCIPAEYIVNTRDPGIYTIVSERLAATGELFKRDRLIDAVADFHPFYDDKKYPGFFIREGFGGGGSLVVPQFFPGTFALIGAGTLAFGTWGGLYVVPVLGALSVGVAFALSRELFGVRAGFFGAALLAVSYTQVWWSRHPSSEVASQLLIITGLWLTVRFTKERDAATGIFAGVLLGAAMLVRVDAFLAALALPVLFAYDLLTDRSARYAFRWLYPGVPLALFAAAAGGYLATFGSRYLEIIYAEHGLSSLLSNATTPTVVMLALAVTFFLLRRRFGVGLGRYLRVRGDRISLVAAVSLVAVALYGYFVVPVPWEELPAASRDFDAYKPQILPRLVWFTTPAVAVLGLIGLVFAASRISPGRFAVAGAMLSFAVLYTFVPNVAPDLPWATRRFVPAAFPVFFLLAGFACSEIGRYVGLRLGRFGAASSALLFAVGIGWTVYLVLPILPFRELDGAVRQFDELNARIPASEVVFMEMPDGYDVSASTLEYAYGRDVLPYDRLRFIREKEALQNAGLLEDAIYITTDGGPAPTVSGLDFERVGSGRIKAPRLKPDETQMPMQIEYLDTEYGIFRIEYENPRSD